MARTYQPRLYMRAGNAMVTLLLRCGVKLGAMTLLTVPGRKSGLPRTTPVASGESGGRRWVISPYGQVDWVRNLRAAGRGTLTRGRRSEELAAIELPPSEAAPILKESLAGAPEFIRQYFDVTPDSPIEDYEREIARHPVFEFVPLEARAAA